MAAIAGASVAGVLAVIFALYFSSSSGSAGGDTLPLDNSTQVPIIDDPLPGYRKIEVTVNGVQLVADVASTGEQRGKGLAIKDTLAENESMLFVFPEPDDYRFWMKDMKFPIDIIWIDDDKEVVHIEHSLEPCAPVSFCPTYQPDRDALYVLETVAGFAQKYNVTDGTHVDFTLEEEKE